jgi:ornithine cyclodeaminase
MVRVYSAAEVHAALPWPDLADALQAAFVRGAQVPLRHAHALAPTDTLLLMPAWDERLLITKLVTVIPGAPSTVEATVMALDRATGHPLAVLDGEALTLRRTAATSALAARHLASPEVETLLVVGTGRLAAWMARAHVALRPGLRRVLVWGRRLEAAQALAAELAAEFEAELHAKGLPVQATADLEAAVRQARLITCATTSTEPLVRGAWLAPGTHLDLVGGFRRDMREADDEAVARARIVVDTHAGAGAEAGDVVQPLQRGVITAEAVLGELAELLRGDCVGRRHPEDITLFKSVGTALEDLAAARLVLGAH